MVSCFGGRGKKTAWDTCTTHGDITPAFCALDAVPDPRAIDEWMHPLDLFVVLLYDRTKTEEGANQARKQPFSEKGRAMMVCLLHSLHSSNTPRQLPTWLVTVWPK